MTSTNICKLALLKKLSLALFVFARLKLTSPRFNFCQICCVQLLDFFN